jgi:hypothetical protein
MPPFSLVDVCQTSARLHGVTSPDDSNLHWTQHLHELRSKNRRKKLMNKAGTNPGDYLNIDRCSAASGPALSPSSLLSNLCRRLFPRGLSGRLVKLTTYFHLMPKLRIWWAIRPHPHTCLWHGAAVPTGARINPLTLLLNNIQIFSLYLTGITSRLSYKAQPVNAVWGNSRCLLWEPYGTHKSTVWAECRVLVC